MPTITTNDGVEIFFKDSGSGQPIVFSHGWPLSADDWDTQMLFFLSKGYRVIAHDRRGHGRSSQVADNHDMDHYADDLAAVVEHLDLHDVIHIGHSTGGGEVAHYLARHGDTRAVKAALISAVPPLMVRTDANPRGWKVCVRRSAGTARRQPVGVLPRPAVGAVLRFQPTRRRVVGGDHRELVAAGDDGGAKAHYDGIVTFSQTDFTEDLKKITIPVLVMHSEDDQIVPYVAAGPKSAELLPTES